MLARFFVDDPDDAQAAERRPAAVAALAGRSFVTVTVLLELEWVLRGFSELPKSDVFSVLRGLANIEHITIEDRDAVLTALVPSTGVWIGPMRCTWRAVPVLPDSRPSTNVWTNGPSGSR